MPLCDYEGWLEFRPDGVHDVSLHEYEEIETIENCTVQILKCRACGKISIGGSRGPLPIKEKSDECFQLCDIR